jgi:DNA-binding HxlR family transcriptional regulator
MESCPTPRTYNVFRLGCPSHKLMELLSSKWTLLVICSLRAGICRFGEMSRVVEGITPKMLTQTLRSLEDAGIVTRRVFPLVPPRVDYELTPLGRELEVLVEAIREWAEAHVPEIEAARQARRSAANA